MPTSTKTIAEERKRTLPVNHPQAGYVSPDLSFRDGLGTLPDELEDAIAERDADRDAEAEAVAEAEDKAVKDAEEKATKDEPKVAAKPAPKADS